MSLTKIYENYQKENLPLEGRDCLLGGEWTSLQEGTGDQARCGNKGMGKKWMGSPSQRRNHRAHCLREDLREKMKSWEPGEENEATKVTKGGPAGKRGGSVRS